MVELDNFENITESMNDDQYEGKWYSYIHNMIPYRVRYLDDEFSIFQATETSQFPIDTPEVREILRSIERRLCRG